MKTILLVLVKNPFSKRDFDRMGIAELENDFDVKIMDCTSWLMPEAIISRGQSSMKLANLYFIDSLKQFKNEIRKYPGGIAVDYVGQFSIMAIIMFYYIKKYRYSLVVMDSGAYPLPTERNLTEFSFRKIAYAIKNRYIQRVFGSLVLRTFMKILPDLSAEFALVSGTSWLYDSRFIKAKNKIEAHSFDYEKYLYVRNIPPSRNLNYAVYLDENIAGHEDNAELGYADPVSKNIFFESLSRFFRDFESATGMTVLVAGYPTERPDMRPQLFEGRKIIYDETAELIRDSKLVFAHASTAISYAVLWKRPIVFLTSHEITKSWYFPWLDAPRKILKSSMFDIDEEMPDQKKLSLWYNIDLSSYQYYKEKYIKSSISPEISLWKIFLKVKCF